MYIYIYIGYSHRYQPPDLGYSSHQPEENRTRQKLWKTWNHILKIRGQTSIGTSIGIIVTRVRIPAGVQGIDIISRRPFPNQPQAFDRCRDVEKHGPHCTFADIVGECEDRHSHETNRFTHDFESIQRPWSMLESISLKQCRMDSSQWLGIEWNPSRTRRPFQRPGHLAIAVIGVLTWE